MASVFDVATALIDRSGEPALNTVKLQKLCFFTFGWYAHLTGESLFPEMFYAMEKGPVVGELLSAHAGEKAVSSASLLDQFEARDETPHPLEPYASAVVDAVLSAYGQCSPWDLVTLTHQETVWQQAWTARPERSQRGSLPQTDIIDYFLRRAPHEQDPIDLPPSVISFLSAEDQARIDAASGSCEWFIGSALALKGAAQ